MTETEHAIARLAAHAPRAQRSAKRVALASGAVLLTLIATTALVLSISGTIRQNATVACQGELQRNQDAQNKAGQESRLLLRQAAQQAADSETAKAADILTMLDPLVAPDVRKVAASDFGYQSTLIAQAWQSYVDESERADRIRAKNPTSFKC